MFNLKDVIKVVEKNLNINLYKNQIHAIETLDKGYIANIETGEGKTIIIATLAVYSALQNKKVVVLTPNDYLNGRDFSLCCKIASEFNLTCSENKNIDIINEEDKKEIYNSNIIYSTCSEFVFDYLRNKNNIEFVKDILKRRLIIDEIDQVIVDNSNTNYSISENSGKIDDNELSIYLLAKNLCKYFIGGKLEGKLGDLEINEQNKYDFVFNNVERSLIITERGYNKITHLLEIDLKDKSSIPVISAIRNTLEANYLFVKDIHYTVKDKRISVIDLNNGRFKKNNHFSSGINLALEIKEKCDISNIPDNHLSINGLFLFSQFEDLVGCSGTVYDCKNVFQTIFKKDVKKIKRNTPKDITEHKPAYFETLEEKYDYIIELIERLSSQNLPILIVAESDLECKGFINKMENQTYKYKVLTNDNLNEETDIISNFSKENLILISTLISGRGTDIIINNEISNIGGLQIIFLSRFLNKRAENQIIGRTGRQGQKGSIYYVSSLQDKIFNNTIISKKNKIENYFKNKNYKKLNKEIEKLQSTYSVENDSVVFNLYKKNYICNLFENYLINCGITHQEMVMDEIESFISVYPTEDKSSFNTCILDTKKFVDELLGGKLNERNVEPSV